MPSVLMPCQKLKSFTLHNVGVDVQEDLFRRLAVPKDCTVHIMTDSVNNLADAIHPYVLLSRQPRLTHLALSNRGLTIADERNDKLRTFVVEVDWFQGWQLDVSSLDTLDPSHITTVDLSIQIIDGSDESTKRAFQVWDILSLLSDIRGLSFKFDLHLLKELISVDSLPAVTHLRLWWVRLDAPVVIGGISETNLSFLLKWLNDRRTVDRVAPIRTIELENCGFGSEETLERLRTEGQVEVVVQDRRRDA